MKIAIAASEAAPFVKTGGLGDVMQALPEALSRIPGNEVCLFLPLYGSMKRSGRFELEFEGEFYMTLAWRQAYVGLYRLKSRRKKLRVYFIDNEQYFDRMPIYGQGDDAERFAFFSKAVLACMNFLDFRPEIINCNDWQTALIPLLLKEQYNGQFPGARTVFTIHNVEYQGWAGSAFNYDVLGLPAEADPVLRFGNAVNFMKAAIVSADAVSTVSETYAGELQYPYYSHGMSDVLSSRLGRFFGITNGIDTTVFDPEHSQNLPCNFTSKTMKEGKAANKSALQEELGLTPDPDTMLLAMVSRLAGHKGIDLLCYIGQMLMERPVQLAIVGTGEYQFEQALQYLACQFPGRVAVRLAFDPGLADRVYAGADAYLMPSRSEPCGLSQLIAMHYGTVPVVHATGGLKDTVIPYNAQTDEGRGFTFQSYNGEDFLNAVDRALELYTADRKAWDRLAARDMELDFSWKVPAAAYMKMYRTVCEY